MATVVSKTPCPGCRANGADTTGDNLVTYSDGGDYCFACGFTSKGSNKPDITKVKAVVPIRGIQPATLEKYSYFVDDPYVPTKHYAYYHSRSEGPDVSTHVRFVDPKGFVWKNAKEDIMLFGQHLWNNKGQRIIVTEGELDCMTIAQALQNRMPVVSVPSGAGTAVNYIRENLDFLLGYNEVVFCFDKDAPGREAAKSCAMLLPAGKAKIAELPLHDANEMLKANRVPELLVALNNATVYTPDEILDIKEIDDDIASDVDPSSIWKYPWNSLTKKLTGARRGEIVLWTSGSGSGKSTILRNLTVDHGKSGRRVGMIMLEESPKDTKLDLMSMLLGHPIRIMKALKALELIEKLPYTNEEIEKVKAEVESWEHVKIYDSQGEKAFDRLQTLLHYMAIALKLDVIIIDHINVLATAEAGSKDIQERAAIDNLLQNMRSLVTRTGVHIDVICQLKKDTKAYEEGDDIVLQDLKGSGNLITVPDTIVAMVRNRQALDPDMANTTFLKVLKNRFSGDCGMCTALTFEKDKMSFIERKWGVDEKGNLKLEPPGSNF